MLSKPRVCVVGAGVAGLTSALRILQSCKDRVQCVDIIADQFGSETTSHAAAGLWGPYKMSNTPAAQLAVWGDETYRHLLKLYYSPEAVEAGVGLVSCYELYLNANEPPVAWSSSLLQYQPVVDIEHFGRYAHGVFFSAPLCEGRWYLPWLTKQIKELQVGSPDSGFQQRHVDSLQELKQSYDVIINCTGLGSKALLGDNTCYPIRGQIMRVHAPWVKHAYFFGESYIIPTRDNVVLGGTGQVGDGDTSIREADSRRIMDGVCELVPSLRGAEVITEWTGLRPGRTQLRLDLEHITDAGFKQGGSAGASGAPLTVIHNYGHGGGGLSLAWGCAGDVVRLLQTQIV